MSRRQLAPFGRHTRYILTTHLRHLLIISAALLSLALTIDLVPQIGRVLAHAQPGHGVGQIVLLVILRAADLFPRFLPLAAYFAVVWTEVYLTNSRERVLLWNSGRTPLRCLVPAAALGVLLAPAQYLFDAYVRPEAMGLQISEQLGTLGEIFDRSPSDQPSWLHVGPNLVRARLDYERGVLSDVAVYRFDSDGHLAEVDTAAVGIPAADAKSLDLKGGRYWETPKPAGSQRASVSIFSGAGQTSSVNFSDRVIDVRLDPLWIRNFGIDARFLTQLTLISMSRVKHDAETDGMVRTTIQVNRANALMPLAMVLFASALALLLFAYRVEFVPAFFLVLAGYAWYLAMRTMVVVGLHAYLPPYVAAWSIPLLLFLCSGTLLYFQDEIPVGLLNSLWRRAEASTTALGAGPP